MLHGRRLSMGSLIGEYNLVAQPFLEGPQGNRIGRAFDASADQSTGGPGPEAFGVAFTIGRSRP
jgi:hypothetical protein